VTCDMEGTYVGISLVSLVAYIIPGFMAKTLRDLLKAPSEKRSQEVELLCAYLLYAAPILACVHLLLTVLRSELVWLPDIFSLPANVGLSATLLLVYLVTALLPVVVEAWVVSMLERPFIRVVNWLRRETPGEGLGVSESVWATLFTPSHLEKGKEETSQQESPKARACAWKRRRADGEKKPEPVRYLEARFALPGGEQLRGRIDTATQADRCRELLVSDLCGTWEGPLPDYLYVNVETGAVVPLWRCEDESGRDA